MHTKTSQEFFADLDDFDTAMLVTRDGAHLRSRPMASHVDPHKRSIRFLTSISTHKISEIEAHPQANLVFSDDDDSFISVSGRLRISRDNRDIDELWSTAAGAWMDKSEAAVLIMEPEIAEYWDASDNAIKAGWEIAKGVLTGKQPDIGENRKLTL